MTLLKRGFIVLVITLAVLQLGLSAALYLGWLG
ncbi:hypothetical protein ABIE78_001722 [Sinorhizobium fredii]